MNIQLPSQTQYELKSLRLIMDGEGSYATIEEREAVIDRLRYSISETVITMLLCPNSQNLHQ